MGKAKSQQGIVISNHVKYVSKDSLMTLQEDIGFSVRTVSNVSVFMEYFGLPLVADAITKWKINFWHKISTTCNVL